MRRRPLPKGVRATLTEDDLSFLDGLLSGLDDLPDGAWQAVCESRIESTDRWPKRDPFDVWMEWVQRTPETT